MTNQKSIIIKGAGFENRGAQLMCLITMYELHTLFPSHKIIVISDEVKKWKKAYDFDMDCEFVSIKLCQIKIENLFSYSMQIYNKNRKWKDMDKLLESTDRIVDISGYTLSSQWGIRASLDYLYEIAVAKYYHVPVYLLPQSFGPLDYGNIGINILIHSLMKKYIKYPKIICAREQEGYRILAPYSAKNLKLCRDIVLFYNKDIATKIKHKNPGDLEMGKTSNHSVLIIPNVRNNEHGNGQIKMIKIYRNIIDELLSRNIKVCLMSHSMEDKKICQRIKRQFEDVEDVYFMNQDLLPEQIGRFMRQFDYAIVSRYHGIVLAYRELIPCIVIGWATKYKELLELFRQQKYFYSVSGEISQSTIQKMISDMEKNYKIESGRIGQRRKIIKNKFDFRWIQ